MHMLEKFSLKIWLSSRIHLLMLDSIHFRVLGNKTSCGGSCGNYTYMGFGQLFIPSYIRTDLNWSSKVLIRQCWKSGILRIGARESTPCIENWSESSELDRRDELTLSWWYSFGFKEGFRLKYIISQFTKILKLF